MKKNLILIFIIAALLLGTSFALDGVAQSVAQREHVWLMETLLPGGEDFKYVPYDGEDGMIRSVHKSTAGFVIETVTQGYADELVMYVGVNSAGNVVGLVIYDAHETFGLGSRILTDDKFLSQFLNRSGSFSISADGTDLFSGATGDGSTSGDEIYVDGISGATVSSKAVARCVSAAVAYVTGADIESSATSWGE